ncbi:MAG: hypothetical protein FJ398_01110 [Verrucomicrobia bacterium]|nr:hypothetical protein [Verrucomicrobiota bacterium]
MDAEFNELALALFSQQFEHVPAYRRFCEARGVTPQNAASWKEIPAIPTSAFKEFDLSSLPPVERTRVFHSSGTTAHKPSRHFHSRESLEIYEASLRPWFQKHVLPELQLGRPAFRFLILTPPPALAPHSSLVHMFEMVRREFAPGQSLFVGSIAVGRDAFHRVPDQSSEGAPDLDHSPPRRDLVRDGVESVPTRMMGNAWRLQTDRAWASLAEAADNDQPVVLLGTAFSFVELLDWMFTNQLRLSLPSGSRALETGGYKGRTRALPKAELYAMITGRLGIPSTHIVCEYGMSELSSQAYDRVAGAPESQISNFKFEMGQRLFRFPPWARVQVVSPETGREVGEGETGLLRIYDLANVRSVLAVQTEDLSIRRGEGFELVGRAAFSEPRGCSLMSTALP